MTRVNFLVRRRLTPNRLTDAARLSRIFARTTIFQLLVAVFVSTLSIVFNSGANVARLRRANWRGLSPGGLILSPIVIAARVDDNRLSSYGEGVCPGRIVILSWEVKC